MGIDGRVKSVLNEQTAVIRGLQQQVSALEYMLTQTMTIALRSHPEPHELLTNMQVLFAEKAQAGGIVADSGDEGFQSAERIFSVVRASID